MAKITLKEAKALWKSLPVDKLWQDWSAAELFTRETLLKMYSEKELNDI